jgi:predicted nucleotidyltransferase component of viral defense system
LRKTISARSFCGISARDTTLTFKGGTCLAKVHAGFYRLSEDSDFSISMPTDSARSVRSRAAAAYKAAVTIKPTKVRSLSRGSVQSVQLPCISLIEVMAEKFRAALSRRDVAIRDFYDIDHAVRNSGLNPLQLDLLELIARKLAVPNNGAMDVSETRRQALHQQLDAQLKPVLRPQDFSTITRSE